MILFLSIKMEDLKTTDCDKNFDINSLIHKLANSNDIKAYKSKTMKYIEENMKTILGSIKNDKKTYYLLMRTYYLNEIDKIEKDINNDELLNNNCKLTSEQYLKLLSFINVLLSFEDLYIYKIDQLKSLQLQSKIIKILKNNFINKIDLG